MTMPKPIYLHDYKAPSFYIDKVDLEFVLAFAETHVYARLHVKRNGKHEEALILNGNDLKLVVIKLDDEKITNFTVDAEYLTIPNVPDDFILITEVIIRPQENTRLEGLYASSGLFCTQCESHGFRRITYFVDRPDNLAIFTAKITAKKQEFPVLLSNGNLEACGESGEYHWVKWSDPSLKPCYLFALIAGDLSYIEDEFITCSGKKVILRAYADVKQIDKCKYALESVKRAMAWDEKNYGREYDLNIFMIVAIDDFNSGAMENKGINTFNTKYILANSKTATDNDYINVENVVGHEYFHNWTGDRVTLRDWFQLSLKEGLTMFRDQSFSADMHSWAVRRIKDANIIRSVQFTEDSSPMSHSVRPSSYIEIDNFYTATVYHKGAEVVRMLHTILGPKLFRAGMDLYFQRYDGKAVTTDDFVNTLADAANMNLEQFKLWYSQAKTPVLDINDKYTNNTYSVTITQSHDHPMHIPLAMALIDDTGKNGATTILSITKKTQTFSFEDVKSKPIVSLLRNFSAPVKINYDYSDDDLLFLMIHDQDPFCRWNAGQRLAINTIFQLIADYQNGKDLILSKKFIQAFQANIHNMHEDAAFVALLLTLPTESYLIEMSSEADVDAIHFVSEFVKKQLATGLYADWLHCYQSLHNNSDYDLSQKSMGRRALKNLALSYLMQLERDDVLELCLKQYESATNMTETLGALVPLANISHAKAQEKMQDFYNTWQHESLQIDKWLTLQATSKLSDAVERVQTLTNSSCYDIKNPNKVYALIRSFSMLNHVNFHRKDGAGYKLLADQVLRLDKINPHVAGRIVIPLINWRKFDKNRQQSMLQELDRIKSAAKLSKNVYEVVARGLEK